MSSLPIVLRRWGFSFSFFSFLSSFLSLFLYFLPFLSFRDCLCLSYLLRCGPLYLLLQLIQFPDLFPKGIVHMQQQTWYAQGGGRIQNLCITPSSQLSLKNQLLKHFLNQMKPSEHLSSAVLNDEITCQNLKWDWRKTCRYPGIRLTFSHFQQHCN